MKPYSPGTLRRKENEKRIVEQMIRLYCRHKEGNSRLCPQCEELLSYCNERLDLCPRMDVKTSCKQCPIHCYRPYMRQRISQVMR